MKTIGVLLSFLTIVWLTSGCTLLTQQPPPDHSRQLVEKNTRHFNPGYFTRPGHRAIPFDIEGGKLELSSRRIEDRPGPLPYRPPETGDVVVVYKDRNGRELGRSIVEDPTQIRYCDSDQNKGGKLGERKLVQNGRYDLLLPADNRIVELEILHVAERFPLTEKLTKEGVKAIQK